MYVGRITDKKAPMNALWSNSAWFFELLMNFREVMIYVSEKLNKPQHTSIRIKNSLNFMSGVKLRKLRLKGSRSRINTL